MTQGNSTDTRTRFLDAGARLFRRRGYTATGVKQLVADGGAPLGSLYYFFPNGKAQIALEGMLRTAEHYELLLDRVFQQHPDIGDAASAWFRMASDALRASDYQDGCPIGTLASEIATTNDELRQGAQDVFAAWQHRVAERLVELRVERREARRLAAFAVSALEGAILLGRVQRNTSPLNDTGRIVAQTLRSAAEGAA